MVHSYLAVPDWLLCLPDSYVAAAQYEVGELDESLTTVDGELALEEPAEEPPSHR